MDVRVVDPRDAENLGPPLARDRELRQVPLVELGRELLARRHEAAEAEAEVVGAGEDRVQRRQVVVENRPERRPGRCSSCGASSSSTAEGCAPLSPAGPPVEFVQLADGRRPELGRVVVGAASPSSARTCTIPSESSPRSSTRRDDGSARFAAEGSASAPTRPRNSSWPMAPAMRRSYSGSETAPARELGGAARRRRRARRGDRGRRRGRRAARRPGPAPRSAQSPSAGRCRRRASAPATASRSSRGPPSTSSSRSTPSGSRADARSCRRFQARGRRASSFGSRLRGGSTRRIRSSSSPTSGTGAWPRPPQARDPCSLSRNSCRSPHRGKRPPWTARRLPSSSSRAARPRIRVARSSLGRIDRLRRRAPRRLRLDPDDRLVSWLPLYHDLGLISGPFMAAAVGHDAVLCPTETFAGSPASWCELLAQERATCTIAPDFAYGVAARTLAGSRRLDLSRLRAAFDGGEQDRPANGPRIVTAGERHGGLCSAPGARVRPGRGDARGEPVPARAGTRSRPRRPRRAGAGTAARTRSTRPLRRRRRSPGWLAAPGNRGADRRRRRRGRRARGRRGRGTEPVDHARLPRAARGSLTRLFDDGWLRTGDLGYVAEGELLVCGREKDVIVLGGRNVQPDELRGAGRRCRGRPPRLRDRFRPRRRDRRACRRRSRVGEAATPARRARRSAACSGGRSSGSRTPTSCSSSRGRSRRRLGEAHARRRPRRLRRRPPGLEERGSGSTPPSPGRPPRPGSAAAPRAPRREVVAVVVEHRVDLDTVLGEAADRVDPVGQLLWEYIQSNRSPEYLAPRMFHVFQLRPWKRTYATSRVAAGTRGMTFVARVRGASTET